MLAGRQLQKVVNSRPGVGDGFAKMFVQKNVIGANQFGQAQAVRVGADQRIRLVQRGPNALSLSRVKFLRFLKAALGPITGFGFIIGRVRVAPLNKVIDRLPNFFKGHTQL